MAGRRMPDAGMLVGEVHSGVALRRVLGEVVVTGAVVRTRQHPEAGGEGAVQATEEYRHQDEKARRVVTGAAEIVALLHAQDLGALRGGELRAMTRVYTEALCHTVCSFHAVFSDLFRC